MATWYLAPSLAACRDEADRLYPDRSRASDGTVGDPAHAARTSDHNPKRDGHGGMVVDAIDLTDDPAAGFDAHAWVRVRCAARDPRLKYAISNGRIWTPERGWVTYTGSNPHSRHVHVSVMATDAARRDASPWFPTSPAPQEDDMALTDAQAAVLVESVETTKRYLALEVVPELRTISDLLRQILDKP